MFCVSVLAIGGKKNECINVKLDDSRIQIWLPSKA